MNKVSKKDVTAPRRAVNGQFLDVVQSAGGPRVVSHADPSQEILLEKGDRILLQGMSNSVAEAFGIGRSYQAIVTKVKRSKVVSIKFTNENSVNVSSMDNFVLPGALTSIIVLKLFVDD